MFFTERCAEEIWPAQWATAHAFPSFSCSSAVAKIIGQARTCPTSAQRSGNRMDPRQLLEHGAGVGLILARAHVNAGTDLAKYREHR